MKRHGENRRRFGCGAGCWELVRWRGQSRGMRGDMRRLSDVSQCSEILLLEGKC